jgi:integrase
LLARGTHPVYVQESLGHASVQLTFDVYSHRMPSTDRNAADGTDEAPEQEHRSLNMDGHRSSADPL